MRLRTWEAKGSPNTLKCLAPGVRVNNGMLMYEFGVEVHARCKT